MTFVKANKGKTSNNNDKVMTPFDIAKELTNLLPINSTDSCLDPFMGTAAFVWWEKHYKGSTEIIEYK